MKRTFALQFPLLVILAASLACAGTAATPPDSGGQEQATPVKEQSAPADAPSMDEAAASFYASDYETALASVNAILQADPDNVEALSLRGLISFRFEDSVDSGS